MTENERLRALLAEARAELARHVFTQESPACVNCGGESGFDVGRACPYAADYALKQRIDAALAKPPRAWSEDAISHTAMLEQQNIELNESCVLLEKQLSEARVEIDRLREMHRVRDEAMRELCLKEVLDEKANLDRGEIEDAIRALPIPEDKP